MSQIIAQMNSNITKRIKTKLNIIYKITEKIKLIDYKKTRKI